MDVRLKGEHSGVDLLKELKRLEPDLVVLIITGYGSVDTAVASLKGGAADYFLKPIDNTRLLESVRKNLEMRALASENRFLKDELVQRSPHTFVTRDPALTALIAAADKVKNQSVTVLITGESGAGKEVLARYIHFGGSRREASFIGLNCAALSESLLLSELFGHERGAFTGAVERKRGKFELADGGTLFLDEIGDMSLEVQAKLLRVIEESAFERLGGVKRITVDVRILSATNKDLPALIKQGKFREDLYYRINVVSFHLPPLRKRRGDIPLLVEHFLAKYSERYVRERVPLTRPRWRRSPRMTGPGNVRELENVVNRIVLLGETGIIGGAPGQTTSDVHRLLPAAIVDAEDAPVSASGPLKAGAGQATARYERRAISEALGRNGGNSPGRLASWISPARLWRRKWRVTGCRSGMRASSASYRPYCLILLSIVRRLTPSSTAAFVRLPSHFSRALMRASRSSSIMGFSGALDSVAWLFCFCTGRPRSEAII